MPKTGSNFFLERTNPKAGSRNGHEYQPQQIKSCNIFSNKIKIQYVGRSKVTVQVFGRAHEFERLARRELAVDTRAFFPCSTAAVNRKFDRIWSITWNMATFMGICDKTCPCLLRFYTDFSEPNTRFC